MERREERKKGVREIKSEGGRVEKSSYFIIIPIADRVKNLINEAQFVSTAARTLRKDISSLSVNSSALSRLMTREGSRSSLIVALFFIRLTRWANLWREMESVCERESE